MLMGIKMRAYPTEEQKQVLSQWMGCARVVWNAKCEEWKYLSTYARKYMPIDVYAPIDQGYSQYKEEALTPYLSKVPSQILRNSTSNWYETMGRWRKGICNPAKRKKKGSTSSVHLTRELYQFGKDETGKRLLKIGTKKFPLGVLKFKAHRNFVEPKSLWIRKQAGTWWVSFCYEDGLDGDTLASTQDRLEFFRMLSAEELETRVIGIDRGVKVAAQTQDTSYDLGKKEKEKQREREKYIARFQKGLARKKKGSKRRDLTKSKISRLHLKNANVRENFCHQTSHALTKESGKLIVMEDLKTSMMTRRAKPKKDITGKWSKNGAAQKSGLNRSILSIGWHKLETLTRYKAHRRGSLLVKIAPHFSSQECADCSHIHPGNRVSQAEFACLACGHRDNADRNAALVLKKRAINLVRHSGTELSEKGVLFLSDIGRGVSRKTSKPTARKQGRRNVKKDGGSYALSPEALAL